MYAFACLVVIVLGAPDSPANGPAESIALRHGGPIVVRSLTGKTTVDPSVARLYKSRCELEVEPADPPEPADPDVVFRDRFATKGA